MRRIYFCALVCAVAFATPGAAEDLGKWSYVGVAENDVFDYADVNTDRYYTHGTQLAAMSPPIDYDTVLWPAKVSRLLEVPKTSSDGRPSRIQIRWGVEVGQNIYTPESLAPIPDPKDHPYAGWAYVGAMVGSYRPTEANTLELQVGLVGPSAGSAWVQNHFHDLIRAARFQGWDHQLNDELAFAVLAERRWTPKRIYPREAGDDPAWAIDHTEHLDLAAGTVQVSAAYGSMIRIGHGLGADYGPPRIRPSASGSAFIMPSTEWSLYAFAGLEGRAVARDIFLDGNTFRDSARVDKRWLVGEANTGAVLRWRGLRLAYTYIWQTERFYGQHGPQRYGSWSVTLVPAGFSRPD
jgi:hypothetical protein